MLVAKPHVEDDAVALVDVSEYGGVGSKFLILAVVVSFELLLIDYKIEVIFVGRKGI